MLVLNTRVVAIIALACFFVLPVLLVCLIKNKKVLNTIIWSVFGFYLLCLILGVWAKVGITRTKITISLDYSYGFCSESIRWGFNRLGFFDVWINLVMLIPVGVMLAFYSKKNFVKTLCWSLVIGLLLGFVIEAVQFILPVKRYIQLSDVVFNSISVVLGVLFGWILRCMAKQKSN